MLARGSLIYAVICYMRGNRDEAVGATCTQFWGRVDAAPKPSPRTEKLLLLYFRFAFIGYKQQRI